MKPRRFLAWLLILAMLTALWPGGFSLANEEESEPVAEQQEDSVVGASAQIRVSAAGTVGDRRYYDGTGSFANPLYCINPDKLGPQFADDSYIYNCFDFETAGAADSYRKYTVNISGKTVDVRNVVYYLYRNPDLFGLSGSRYPTAHFALAEFAHLVDAQYGSNMTDRGTWSSSEYQQVLVEYNEAGAALLDARKKEGYAVSIHIYHVAHPASADYQNMLTYEVTEDVDRESHVFLSMEKSSRESASFPSCEGITYDVTDSFDHVFFTYTLGSDGKVADVTAGSSWSNAAYVFYGVAEKNGRKYAEFSTDRPETGLERGKLYLREAKSNSNYEKSPGKAVIPAVGPGMENRKTMAARIRGLNGALVSDELDRILSDQPLYSVYVSVEKTSGNPSVTNNNPNYSLEGAEYSLYASEEAARQAVDHNHFGDALAHFAISASGRSEEVDVTRWMDRDPETGALRNTSFYVVESKAGKNYLRSLDVTEVPVTPANRKGKSARVEVSDEPVMVPFRLEVEKTDAVTGSSVTASGMSLEGARFRLTFYAEDTDRMRTKEDLQKENSKILPEYTQEAMTEKQADGRVAAVFSGSLPVGFFTIEEVQAPRNYSLENGRALLQESLQQEKRASSIQAVDITDNMIFVAGGTYSENQSVFSPWVMHPGSAVTWHELPEKGIRVDADGPVYRFQVSNIPVRGNLRLEKVREEDGSPMAGVKFEIRNLDTNEVHVIYTNEEGIATTETDSYTDLVNHYDRAEAYDGTENMVWFGLLEDGSFSLPPEGTGEESGIRNSREKTLGALPLGRYSVTEVACEGNRDRQLLPVITVEITGEETLLLEERDGKLYNAGLPVIRTRALAETEEGESKILPAAPDQTIHDICTYENLKADTTYTLWGRLMRVTADGEAEPLLDADGKEITGRTVFKTQTDFERSAYAVCGEEQVEFANLDLSAHGGETFVVYERLYVGDVSREDVEKNTFAISYPEGGPRFPLCHEDASDPDQTISVSAIRTTLLDQKTGGHTATPAEDTVLVDYCSYENLIPGNRYNMKGILMRKDTGEALLNEKGDPITSETSFTASPEGSGTVEVVFALSSVQLELEGKSVVAFEACYSLQGKLPVAVHADLSDQDQTVTFDLPEPEVKDAEEPEDSEVSRKPEEAPRSSPQTGDRLPVWIPVLLVALALLGEAAVLGLKWRMKQKRA